MTMLRTNIKSTSTVLSFMLEFISVLLLFRNHWVTWKSLKPSEVYEILLGVVSQWLD